MQSGTMVFSQMNRVIFGKPAAASIVAESQRLGANRVFVLSGQTLNRRTGEVTKVERVGSRTRVTVAVQAVNSIGVHIASNVTFNVAADVRG